MKRIALIAILLGLAGAAHASTAGTPCARWAFHADTLARVLIAEADERPADWAAIAWTLDHRLRSGDKRCANDPAQIINYSATLRKLTDRVREFHVSDPAEMQRARARQYGRAFAFVRAWLKGKIPDPCPGSTDWRGVDDAHPDWMDEISCGSTINVFGSVAHP